MVTNRDAVTEIGIVEAWRDALNSNDIERLVTLSYPKVEIGGLTELDTVQSYCRSGQHAQMFVSNHCAFSTEATQ
ncbi:MAG: hypothetical protein JOZ19_17495 [Rubrobacter sp.]|nr:hypothetical protein [Rubrobacter sp.]